MASAIKNYPIGTHFAGPVKLGASSVRKSTDQGGIAAIKTLTADESNGQNYILDVAAGFAITLPAPTAGWSCSFTTGIAITTAYVLTAATAGQLQGSTCCGGVVVVCTAGDTLTLDTTPSRVGDVVHLWSDGTSIFVEGNAAVTLAHVVA